MEKMIYIIKWGGLYKNKGNPGLAFTCNCKMGYYMVFKCIDVLVPPYISGKMSILPARP